MLALFALFATLQVEPDPFDSTEAFGKTAHQVVAMGFEAWDRKFHSEGDYTTSSMANSVRIFGSALYDVNTDALRKVDPERRQHLQEVREASLAFLVHYNELSSMASGGGTIWIPIKAGSLYQSEKFFKDLFLTKKYKGAASHKQLQQQVQSTLALMSSDLKLLDETDDMKRELAQAADELVAAINKLVQIRPHLSGTEVAGVNHFLIQQLKDHENWTFSRSPGPMTD